MAYIERELERKILKANDFFKAILVTGARQVGKTTMLKHLAEGTDRRYVSMDNAMARELAQSDPVLFFQSRFDLCRMVCIVIDHPEIIFSGFRLEATLYSHEVRQRRLDRFHRDAAVERCDHGAKRITDIMRPRDLKLDGAERLSLMHHIEKQMSLFVSLVHGPIVRFFKEFPSNVHK